MVASAVVLFCLSSSVINFSVMNRETPKSVLSEPNFQLVVSLASFEAVSLPLASTLLITLSQEAFPWITAELMARMIYPLSTSGSGNLLATGGEARLSAGLVMPTPASTSPSSVSK